MPSGVHLVTSTKSDKKMYRATIGFKGDYTYLGSFESEEEASTLYEQAKGMQKDGKTHQEIWLAIVGPRCKPGGES